MTKLQNNFDKTSLLSSELLERLGLSSDRAINAANDQRAHAWITVTDPNNRRSLLDACDDCGVVKSENSILRRCEASSGTGVISSALEYNAQIAIRLMPTAACARNGF